MRQVACVGCSLAADVAELKIHLCQRPGLVEAGAQRALREGLAVLVLDQEGTDSALGAGVDAGYDLRQFAGDFDAQAGACLGLDDPQCAVTDTR